MSSVDIPLFWAPRVIQTGRSAQRTDIIIPDSVRSDWKLVEDYPDLEGYVVLDFETYDPCLTELGSGWPWGEGYPIGFAIRSEWFGPRYYPLRHANGNVEDPNKTIAWLRHTLQKPSVVIVAANAQYELGWCWYLGIEPASSPIDVQALAALVDENRVSYSLDSLSKSILGLQKRRAEFEQIEKTNPGINLMSRLHELPASIVAPYAETDADLTWKLFKILWDQIFEQDLEKIERLERDVMVVAARMRRRGVRVNVDYAERVRTHLENKEKEIVSMIRIKTGKSVDCWSAESIADVFASQGVSVPLTETGRPSITREWLRSQKHPIANQILDLRRFNKARTTFVEGHILRHAKKGRIHAEFHPLRRETDQGGFGTVTGRFSSANPNLQQIPSRDKEICAMIRSLFLPEEGELWASLDYASQEPRITVHFAARAKCPGAARIVALFQENPDTDLHSWVAKMAGIERSQAKMINLGLTYGMGGASLCRNLGLPTEIKTLKNGDVVEVAGPEGQALLDQYHEAVPFIRCLMEKVKAAAQSRGYITTILGRRCRFPKGEDGEPAFIHKALNRLIQSSAADQMKKSMLDLWEEGYLPLVTVHDELGFSVKNPEEAEQIKEIMENSIRLEVPSRVQLDIVRNWGEAKVGAMATDILNLENH